ncbi:hypothetical protein BDF21DRAFT_417096 [Thamnidium elegans]|nr:hypothetical protein BDF21DRAFT_417096 [Thamnidium elegans]
MPITTVASILIVVDDLLSRNTNREQAEARLKSLPLSTDFNLLNLCYSFSTDLSLLFVEFFTIKNAACFLTRDGVHFKVNS